MSASILTECMKIAGEAGRMIRTAWFAPRRVRHKGAIDLVTETDMAVQKFLRDALGRLLPEAGFMGEEDDGMGYGGESLCWVVDPVDGTTNFVHRLPHVATSIALCDNGRPIFGVVNAPMLNECFSAGRDQGAWLNGEPIAVSGADRLADALIATGFPYEITPNLAGIMARLDKVLPATQGLRRLGSAALDLASVACGRMDSYYEEILHPWDMAAGWLLVEEGGGMVTRMDGSPMGLGGPILASNGKIHGEMLKLLDLRNGPDGRRQ